MRKVTTPCQSGCHPDDPVRATQRLVLPSDYRPEGFYTFDLCGECAEGALLDTDHFKPIRVEVLA